jgi:hypothetical protein
MLFLTTEYVKQANAELKKLESYSQVPDDFTVVDNHQRYKNIIVVVGKVLRGITYRYMDTSMTPHRG